MRAPSARGPLAARAAGLAAWAGVVLCCLPAAAVERATGGNVPADRWHLQVGAGLRLWF